MRLFSQVLSQWPNLEQHDSLNSLKTSVEARQYAEQPATNEPPRSACWKAFLVTKSVDTKSWPADLGARRKQYEALREQYLRGPREDETDSFSDPLTEGADSSWADSRRDDTLREEILQDVERCMPENLYFRQPGTKSMLQDILFVWSKLNPNVSYRQGMHEVLAPLVWAVERDAIDPTSLNAGQSHTSRDIVKDTFDATFIEHDSFALFNALMETLKLAYAARSSKGNGHRHSNSIGSEPEIVARSRIILNEKIAAADPQLGSHLVALDIPPQLFLMRWIRLLFGREFRFDESMQLWDCIFAEGASPDFIDLLCVVMVLRIRWQVINADHNTSLGLLLHYPPLRSGQRATDLVHDAKLLQDGLNSENGTSIIRKHTGKAPIIKRTPSNLESVPLRPDTAKSYPDMRSPHLLPPPRPIHQPRNSFDVVMQNAARSVYSSGERLGVNKAVRDAVGDVRKNVQNIRSDIVNRSHSRNTSTASNLTDSQSPEESLQKSLNGLTARNRSLAHMLESAVTELWKQQKEVSAEQSNKSSDSDDERVKSFTMAIAKVQLAQVYLEDPELPLPEDEPTTEKSKDVQLDQQPRARSKSPTLHTNYMSPIPDNLARSPQASPGTEIDPLHFAPTREAEQGANETTHTASEPAKDARPPLRDSHFSYMLGQDGKPPKKNARVEPAPARPSLEQSSFSWMLGQHSTSSSAGRSSFEQGPFKDQGDPRTSGRRSKANRNMNFLFGEPNDAS